MAGVAGSGDPFHTAKHILHLVRSQKSAMAALSAFDAAARCSPDLAHTPPVFLHLFRKLTADAAAGTASLPILSSHVSRLVAALRARPLPRPFPEEVPLAAIRAFSAARDPDAALSLFRDMELVFRCRPGIHSYNTLLNAFVESKQWAKAESFFAYYETALIQPNIATFNILIKALIKKRKIGRAKSLLATMRARGIAPDKVTYSTVLKGLLQEQAASLDDAVELFDEMCERGVTPDTVCFNNVIDGLFKKRAFDKAMAVWRRLLDSDSACPSVVTYNIMLSGLFNLGRFDEAMAIWERMKVNQCRPDSFTYTTMIHGLCSFGAVEEASKLYYGLRVRDGCGLPSIAMSNALPGGFCKTWQVSQFLDLWECMGKSG